MRTAGVAAALALAWAHIVFAQDDTRALVEKAVAYVERFQRDFGSIVSEERYEQALRPARNFGGVARGVPQQTVLLSDFLLVQVRGEEWLPFRDVFDRDGKPVRDREERLAKIFLAGGKDAFEQARTIMDEGARHNIGNVSRNINTPTLALLFLTSRHLYRFEFKRAKPRESDTGVPIEFREKARPTFITTTNGRDLPVRGRFIVDETSGTVLQTELDAVDTAVEAHVVVTYVRDEAMGFFVPARMEERYQRPRDPMEVRGVATYSKFRRFQVSTSEELAR